MKLNIDEINQKYREASDPKLPEWAGKIIRFIYLGFSLFLIASSLTLMGCSSSANASDGLNWRNATNVIPEERAIAIIQENSAAEGDEQAQILESMRVYESDGGLLFVDFNSPLLTGKAGSLYAIYDGNERIFNRYLSKDIPDGVPVIQTASSRSGGYPCLIVHTVSDSPDTVKEVRLCFNGEDWVVTSSEDQLIEQWA